MFDKVPYATLNSRQQENRNFHKVAARLADYGFNCMRLTDDWQGADFIALHVDGKTILKVQLKGRLVIDRKYQTKGIHIAFLYGDDLFLYDHDAFLAFVEREGKIGEGTRNWHQNGYRLWPTPPSWAMTFLNDYRISR